MTRFGDGSKQKVAVCQPSTISKNTDGFHRKEIFSGGAPSCGGNVVIRGNARKGF